VAGEADFVVQSPDKKVQLIVEAKSRSDATQSWAAQLRRNLVAHSAIPAGPYFLLALPDRFYLWRDGRAAATVPPDFVIDGRAELAPYMSALKVPSQDLSEQGFELLVQTWLQDLVTTNLENPGYVRVRDWLKDSGLSDSIRHGTVKSQVSP